MRDMNLKNNFKRAAGLSLIAAGALMASQAAMACQLTAWDSSIGSPIADDPLSGPSDPVVPRYSGLCGMQAEDGAVSGVRDNSPGGIDRIRARFYVLLNNSGNTAIYNGLDSGDTSVFSVAAASNGDITLIGGGTTVGPVSGNVGAWNSIEIDWDPSGAGATLTVNEQTPQNQSVGGSTSPIASVELGNLQGAAGTLIFDSYESRRTEEIGRLCVGDADNSGSRGLGDLQAIFDEFQFGTLASGQPDADENGSVGLSDLQTVFEIFQFGTAACPAP